MYTTSRHSKKLKFGQKNTNMKKLRNNRLWKVPECKHNQETYFNFFYFRLDSFKDRQTACPVEVPPELKKGSINLIG